MTKTKKIILIVLAAILALVAIFGIFYVAAPREFMQLFLNDEKYTEFTLAKNGKDVAKIIKTLNDGENAYAFQGTISADIDKSLLLNNETIASTISDYLQDISISGSLMAKDKTFDLSACLADNDGAILTTEAILNDELKIFNVSELDTGWFKYENQSEDASDTGTDEEEAATEESTYDITILDEKEVRVSETAATGEAVCIEIDRENFELLLESVSSYIPEENRETFDYTKLSNFLEKYDITDINLNLYINKKNEIVAFELSLEGEENYYIIGVLNKENSKVALEFTTDDLNSVIEVSFTKAPFEDFEIPSSTEITTLNFEGLKSAFMDYFLGDFISAHSEFEDAAISIASSLFSELLQSAFSIESDSLSSITDSFTNIFGNLFGGSQ